MAGINDGLGSVFRAEGPEAAGRLRRIPSVYDSTGVGRGIRSDVLNEMGIMGVDPQLVRELDQKTGTGDSAFGIIPNEIPSLAALQEELAKVKSMAAPISSSLSNLQASKKVSEKIEAMPDDSDVFAPSALDMMAAPMPNLSINSQGDRVLSQTNSAGDEAKAQDMIVAKRKKQQEEQLLADKNREASLDTPSDPAEQLFSQAMTDYISQARTGAEDNLPEVGDIEAYKKKFAEATGVDISGKPDTSQALMAMGLSMMQNRAGKGFNVGRMLSSVGEAGEKALPALTAAKAEARNNVIAAGKYALTAQDADEKTRKAAEKDLMNRGNYWIYKKGGKQGEFLRDKNGIMPFDEGSFEYLNKSEMNKLINDPEFNKQFSFIDADKRFEILKSRAEALGDKDDQWMEYDNRSMIGGELKDTPRDLIAFAAAKNSNVSGQKTNFKMGETAQTVVDRFQGLQRTINRGGDQFETLINAIDTGISIPKQIASTVVTLGRNLGLDLGDGPTDIKTAQTMLKQIAVREATNILQESGKTLSDNDRKRVEELVGEIDFSSGDKALVKKKLKEIHYLTVIKPQQNLDKAVGWLEREAGITFGVKGSPEGIGEPPTKSELAKMNVRRKEAGQPPYTMDMFE